MALWHTRVKTIGRQITKNGKPIPGRHNSLVAAVAYRGGLALTDERTGERYDFRRKAKGVKSSFLLAPSGAPGWMCDPGAFANSIERLEDEQNRHANAQLAREMEFTVPVEISDEQVQALGRSFGNRLAGLGMVVQVSIHEPKPRGGQRNPHIHFLCGLRGLSETGEGFGLKVREWNAPALYRQLLAEWESMVNAALEEAGSAERVDRRSFAERGIDKLPSLHWGRAATALLREGKDAQPQRVLKAEHRRIDNCLRPVLRGIREQGETPQFGMGKSRWERLAFLAGQEGDHVPGAADWQDDETARRSGVSR